MDSDSKAAAGDRLSRLGDGVLGHILSFLPATEAARAAALSRRWRHVFPAVHTLSFAESERALSTGYPWFRLCSYCGPGHSNDVRAPRLVARAGAALHGRDRGGARAPPLRALRVAFDEFGFRGGDATPAVDGWLSYAVYHAAAEIDLRLDTEPTCKRSYTLRRPPDATAAAEQEHEQELDHDAMDAAAAESDLELDDDGGEEEEEEPAAPTDDESPSPGELYVTPRSLFSCAALRRLRLGGCRLDLPSAIALPSLDTLHLTRVAGRSGGGGAVKRLVSACPRLADLTLEACRGLTDLTVSGARLRRLALRCCHELTAVAADSSELRAFEYRGAVPERSSFLTMADDPPKLSFCSLDFCGEEPAAGDSPDSPALVNSLTHLLRQLRGAARLHLTSARLGCIAGAAELPSFPALRNLEVIGMVPDGDAAAVAAVAKILERVPRLETLSLFFMPEPAHPAVAAVRSWDTDDVQTIHAGHKLRYDRYAPLAVPDVEIPCLREKTREINLVHYQGAMAQRMLAKLLLRNAMVVDEVCCEFARGPLSMQNKLMEEIKGWVMNKSANMMFF